MATHSRQSVLVSSIENSKWLVHRFVVGFDDSTHTKQAANLPNHFAWCMGHMALTMHRVAEAIDGKPLPATDFILDVTEGDVERFGTESVCFASEPVDNPAMYPTHARCLAVFDAAFERLVAALRSAEDAALEKTVRWGKGESVVADLVPRMVHHNGVHCGQLIDLRRALGMKPVLA